MKTILIIFIFSLLTLSAFAGEVYIIAGTGVSLSKEEVKEVYLGEKQVSGGIKISPVDNKSLQLIFLSKFIGVDKIKYDTVWAKKSFQDGLTAPKVKGSDSDVIDFIKNNPGAIGYVSAPAGNKVLAIF